MIILQETKLNLNKNLIIALSSVYGLGLKQASKICKKQGFGKTLKVSDLSEDQFYKLQDFLNKSKLLINQDLRKTQTQQIKALVSIKCYRGLRRKRGLPVRGQRTRTNAKTCLKLRLSITR